MTKDPNKVRTHSRLIITWLGAMHALQEEHNLTEGDACFSMQGRMLLCSFSMVPKHDTSEERWYVRVDVKTDAMLFGGEEEEEIDPDLEKEEILFIESGDGRTMVFGANSVMGVIELVHSNLKV